MPSMKFGLSSDQLSLVDTVSRFTQDRITPFAVEWDQQRHLPLDVVRESASLGFGGLYVGSASGGSGLSRLDSVLAFESMARGCPALSAFISVHNMVAWMIDTYGTESQKSDYLPSLISMERIASYCLSEPTSGSDSAALKTTARRDGDDYILNGTKQFITGGGSNDLCLVFARTGESGSRGISCFIVDAKSSGFSYGPQENKMGWHVQPTSQVILEDCRVPSSCVLNGENAGFPIAMSGLDGGRINIAACSLGGASEAYDRAVSYSGEREAFGKPIGSFQSIQFKLAEMSTRLTSGRLLLYWAADCLDTDPATATVACSMAKLQITDMGFSVANDALQIHGGYGYLSEYGIEKIVRDLRVHQILEGTNEIMRLIISRDLRVQAL